MRTENARAILYMESPVDKSPICHLDSRLHSKHDLFLKVFSQKAVSFSVDGNTSINLIGYLKNIQTQEQEEEGSAPFFQLYSSILGENNMLDEEEPDKNVSENTGADLGPGNAAQTNEGQVNPPQESEAQS